MKKTKRKPKVHNFLRKHGAGVTCPYCPDHPPVARTILGGALFCPSCLTSVSHERSEPVSISQPRKWVEPDLFPYHKFVVLNNETGEHSTFSFPRPLTSEQVRRRPEVRAFVKDSPFDVLIKAPKPKLRAVFKSPKPKVAVATSRFVASHA